MISPKAGLAAKLAAGAVGVCLAAGGAGLYVGYHQNAEKAAVVEMETGAEDGSMPVEVPMETADGNITAENTGETKDETVETAAESNVAKNVDEINREAIAAYRKYVMEKKDLPYNPGSGVPAGISNFAIMDLNGDGIWEMAAATGIDVTYGETCNWFLWYTDGTMHEQILAGPEIYYDFSSGKIGAFYFHGGNSALTAYDFDGKQLIELGEWNACDSLSINTSAEIQKIIQEIDQKTGAKHMDFDCEVEINDENLEKYLSGTGESTGCGKEKDDHPFSTWFEYQLEVVQQEEEEQAQNAKTAASVAPYKAQLDTILAGTYSFYYTDGYQSEDNLSVKEAYDEGMLGISWDRAIDKEYYYVLENVQFAVISEEGSSGEIATIPELYVRKDGVYSYDKGTDNGDWIHTDSLEDYLRVAPGEARWGVTFDEKGFITAWEDAEVM